MVINSWKMDFDKYKGLDCTPPCDMYSILYDYGYIDDPYYGTNEEALTDLSRKDCVFYSEFSLSKEELSCEKIDITFLGIDTICDIYLNGALLGSVKNMHRMYEYDIKSLARDKNEIRLNIKAPIPYFEEAEANHHLYTNDDSVQGAAHLRKALYMSGWDWAPKLPNMGIFRPVTVRCYNTDKLGDVSIIQHHKDDFVRLDVSCTTKHNSSKVTIDCIVDGQRITLENGCGEITIENPRLWWPNGYGKQELYHIEFLMYENGVLIDKIEKDIGLRTLCLSRENDEHGQEFCFKINGIKIFAMGANYVPIDILLSRITKERTEELIKDCIFSNFNCIRVWGGAFYPDDYFYELCDKYGLIVWQDFMVACSNIWLTEDMEREFIAEATYNVKRIRHHACLGVLCGNNEMEEAICYWQVANGNDPLVRKDYLKLYEEILPSICKEHAPYISYTPSSPTSGGGFNDPCNYTRGDVHFWHVWNGDCEFDEYRKHKFRFCSEYGFESLPCMKTVEAFCPKDEQNLLSYTMESHQKHKNGNVKLIKYLAERYLMPKDLETTVYASQLNQASAIQYGVEHFRRCRGYTMGSIYWQLNDTWPVASWSSIDYFGRYKALHYFAKRFYQGVALGLFNESDKITINVSNETMCNFSGYIKYGVMKNDFSSVSFSVKQVSVDALSSKDTVSVTNEEFNGSFDKYFFAELYDLDNNLIARNVELGKKPKHFKFLKPSISVDFEECCEGVYLTFKSEALAKNVFVSFKDYDVFLSDNFFDLSSKEPYKILAKTSLSASVLKEKISLISVYDIPSK